MPDPMANTIGMNNFQKSIGGLKDGLIGLASYGVVLGVPGLIVCNSSRLPSLMVGAAWILLFFLPSVVASLAAGGVWGECALPYRGMHPMPGGPGARTIPYHPQLQRRVGTGSRMDWLNWLAGIALRVGLFFFTLVGGLVLVPRSWGDCGLILSLNLLMAVAGFVAVAIPNALITALGRFWETTEPPDLPEAPEQDGVGVAPPIQDWRDRIRALFWRYAPLPCLLLGLTAAPLLLFDPVLGLRLACLGAAAAAVLGYPVWIWSVYRSRH